MTYITYPLPLIVQTVYSCGKDICDTHRSYIQATFPQGYLLLEEVEITRYFVPLFFWNTPTSLTTGIL